MCHGHGGAGGERGGLPCQGEPGGALPVTSNAVPLGKETFLPRVVEGKTCAGQRGKAHKSEQDFTAKGLGVWDV